MSCDRFFRAEKGTANFNAFRTLVVGVALSLVILLGVQPMIYLYDLSLRARPWIVAKDVAYVSPNGRWAIESTTNALRRVSGDRILTQYRPNGGPRDEIICVSERRDTWEGERIKHWTVEAFTGYKCPLPDVPFYICSEFSVKQASGATGAFSADADGRPFCTNLIDPAKGGF